MFDIFFIENFEKISSINTLEIWKTETQTETENQVIYTLENRPGHDKGIYLFDEHTMIMCRFKMVLSRARYNNIM